jgi:hypothetical protein
VLGLLLALVDPLGLGLAEAFAAGFAAAAGLGLELGVGEGLALAAGLAAAALRAGVADRFGLATGALLWRVMSVHSARRA